MLPDQAAESLSQLRLRYRRGAMVADTLRFARLHGGRPGCDPRTRSWPNSWATCAPVRDMS